MSVNTPNQDLRDTITTRRAKVILHLVRDRYRDFLEDNAALCTEENLEVLKYFPNGIYTLPYYHRVIDLLHQIDNQLGHNASVIAGYQRMEDHPMGRTRDTIPRREVRDAMKEFHELTREVKESILGVHRILHRQQHPVRYPLEIKVTRKN